MKRLLLIFLGCCLGVAEAAEDLLQGVDTSQQPQQQVYQLPQQQVRQVSPSWVDDYHLQQYEQDVYERKPDVTPYLRSNTISPLDKRAVQPSRGQSLPQQEVEQVQDLLQESQGPQEKTEKQQPTQIQMPHVNQLQELIQKQINEQLSPAYKPSDRHPKAPSVLRASMLIEAIKNGRVDQVARALRLGVDPNERSREGQTAIELAIKKAASGGRGLQMLQYLIRGGARIDAQTSGGETPLTLALKYRLTDVLALLIAKGADMSAPNAEGSTPIEVAIKTGNPDAFKFFLDQGAAIDIPNEAGDRPLNMALRYHQAEMAMQLILAGVTLDARDADRRTALHQAAENREFDVLAMLVQRGAPVDLRAGPDLDTPLHLAARNGDADSVIYLISKGSANVSETNGNGVTPLMFAAGNAKTNVQLINYLVIQGAAVQASDNDGETALHKAARAGNSAVIQALIKKGASVDAVDNRGHTPLYVAAQASKLDAVKILIQNKASVKTTPSPLEGAVEGGDEKVIKYLIDNGASL